MNYTIFVFMMLFKGLFLLGTLEDEIVPLWSTARRKTHVEGRVWN